MDFYQRRRVVLISFAAMASIFLAMAIVWRSAVLAGVIWLFSDSIGAILLLSVASIIFALKAKRRMTLDAVRRIPAGEGASRGLSPPGGRLILKIAFAMVAFLILAIFLWRR